PTSSSTLSLPDALPISGQLGGGERAARPARHRPDLRLRQPVEELHDLVHAHRAAAHPVTPTPAGGRGWTPGPRSAWGSARPAKPTGPPRRPPASPPPCAPGLRPG